MSSGSLPSGISLSPAGVLSGTPTATGTSSFTVKVTDANGQSATQAASITVAAGVSTTFAAPPAAVLNTAYSDTLTAAGGTAPYTWSVNTRNPAGRPHPVLRRRPVRHPHRHRQLHLHGQRDRREQGIATTSITLVVTSSVTFTFPPPPSGVVGTAYSDTLTAAGGTTPYTWSISAGSLPAGLTLNASTGVVSGTPTTAGTASFTAKVTDAKGKTATFATSITILSSMLTIAVSASTATVAPGGTVTYTITATNSGQATLTGASFTDPLTGVLDDAAYNNDAHASTGTVGYTSPALTWTGDLTPGQAATITFTVTVTNPDTGDKILVDTVTSATPGSNCPAGSGSGGCTVTVTVVAGPLSITVPATATLDSAAPGGTLSSGLGTVQVTDDRGFGAGWTATVSGTSFATGAARLPRPSPSRTPSTTSPRLARPRAQPPSPRYP